MTDRSGSLAGTAPAARAGSTSAPRRSRRRRRARLLAFAGGHVFVLSAFAFAQPLFDLLSRNAEFFAVRGSTRWDIVAFAAGILLLPAVALVLLEAGALALDVLVWRALHLVVVAVLSGLVVLYALQTRVDLGRGLVVLSAFGGAGLAALYLRAPPFRTFLTVLVPAPLLMAGLFLFDSPVSRLLSDPEPTPAPAVVEARAPILLIVFDELATVSLLDERGRVDAERFPNFGRLAERATFYRDATTVHGWTEHAVTAILTGNLPEPGRLPILVDHPQNLFVLLAAAYRLQAHETHTRLCPRSYCRRAAGDEAGATLDPAEPGQGDSLASDVSILYLHVVLPDSLAERLPPIDRSWRNFRRGVPSPAGVVDASEARCVPVCRLVRMLDAVGPETLTFFHAALPHVPWRYLPSGSTYLGDTGAIPGLRDSTWEGDELLTRQARARYLLQVGAADRALGLALDRLQEEGLWDESLVVVTADHGLAFTAGLPRREPVVETLDEIAFVPLFVKLPGQRRGRIEPGFAQTIDIVPTIADGLGVELPWSVSGTSLLGRELAADGTVSVTSDESRVASASLADLLGERGENLREQVADFGTGVWETMYAGGPLARFVGREIVELDVPTADGLGVDLDGSALLEAVDPASSLVPSYVTGRIAGGEAGRDLAVAVNGRIVATGRTYDSFGETRFAALVPESSLQAGANDVQVLIGNGGGSGAALELLEPSEPSFSLDGSTVARAGGGIVLESADVRGELQVEIGGSEVEFSGWAADLAASRPVDAILLFVDGRLVYTASGVAQRMEDVSFEGIEGVGFAFVLPEASLPPPGGGRSVRLFALSGERAAELAYEAAYPWRR